MKLEQTILKNLIYKEEYLRKVVEIAFGDRALKGAMKGADKSGATYVIVLGESEISSGTVELKEMKTGQTRSVKIDSLLQSL